MKLFALHGHNQNTEKFHKQLASLLRRLKKIGIEVVYVDAPYVLPDTDGMRTWCLNNDTSESYNVIQKAYEENPDVIGIIGFSMGAIFALNLAAHAANNPESPYKWIKVIAAIAAPFPSEGYEKLIEYFPCSSDIPVLFVIGLTDKVAPPESQRKFHPFFTNKTIFEHEGGHYIPSSAENCKRYVEFFKNCNL